MMSVVDNDLDEVIVACVRNDIEFIKRFLSEGGDPNYIPPNRNLPLLFCAAIGDKHEIIKLLLENGANINLQNSYGQTALFVAVDSIIDGIVQSGGELEDKNIDTIKLLLQNGADINIRSHEYDLTPLELAEDYNFIEIINLLKVLF